jgi:hypothetical protein
MYGDLPAAAGTQQQTYFLDMTVKRRSTSIHDRDEHDS